jgi:uncharacterized membrane protein YfcA
MPNVVVQTLFCTWQHREQLAWRDAVQVVLYRAMALPAGIFALKLVTEAGQQLTRQVVGIGLVGLLFLQRILPQNSWLWRGQPGKVLAGSASGFLAGALGMGGPPLVLWLLAQEWPAAQQRSFLWLSFLLLMPLQITIMFLTFGRPLAHAMGAGLLVAPLVLVVARYGSRWGGALSKERLRWLMRAFLLVLALRLIIGPWIPG